MKKTDKQKKFGKRKNARQAKTHCLTKASETTTAMHASKPQPLPNQFDREPKARAQSLPNKAEHESSTAYYFYLAFTILLIGAIFATPAISAAGGILEFIASISYLSFSTTCHQIASRSLFVLGEKMPVCARCFAIYFGLLIGALSFPLFTKPTSKRVPHVMWLVLAVTPLALDGLTQFISYYGVEIPFIGIRESTNDLRVITGFLAGFAVSFYAIPIINSILQSCQHKTPAQKQAANSKPTGANKQTS